MTAKRPLMSAIGAGLLVAGTAFNAAADPLGDPAKGKAYAANICASCHAIEPGEQASPVGEAPTFQNVADTPGITRTALIVFFRTPHRTMPNLVVQGDEADDVIAYILSLKVKSD